MNDQHAPSPRTQSGAGELIDQKFRAAWQVFAMTCGSYLAPEASYQAWFAHYLISQFGIDRVAREPVINIGNFSQNEYKVAFDGRLEVRLDAVVTSEPGIMMPHYANRLAKAADESGLGLLNHLDVISELKIAASAADGLDFPEVARDVHKLRMLLHARREKYGDQAGPKAYLCILDNHPKKKRFDKERVLKLAKHEDPCLDIEVLYQRTYEVPGLPPSGKLEKWIRYGATL
ncbi:hypothetical protein [Glutamicibacter arilaitensis]|uniref:hypothetical protein n=1 Tax=Glutamicibacter arilaitensis TaxID=256701 RepID=UPI003F91FD1F